MKVFLTLILTAYPNGFFGVGPASSSDAGMMLEQGLFAVEYNPSGLAWLDSLEVGLSAGELFGYNLAGVALVGAAYNFQGWPLALSFSKNANNWGFSLAGARLLRPLALGTGFSAWFDTLRHEQIFSLRGGIQWREYAGFAIGPRLWTAQDTSHLSVMAQIGAAVPIPIPGIEGLDLLAGAASEFGPPAFRIGSGLAFEPITGLKLQSFVSTQEWGAGILLGSLDDRVGVWIRKEFEEGTPWQVGIAYTRNVRSTAEREVVVYRNVPGRVDTVYLTERESATEDTVTTTHVVSSEVRRQQERLMAQANRFYAAERYEDALATWRQVIELDPSSDHAARAKEDIKEVTALIETLERIRGKKPQ
jgi:hypothetical protein